MIVKKLQQIRRIHVAAIFINPNDKTIKTLLQQFLYPVVHHAERKCRIGKPLAPWHRKMENLRKNVELFSIASTNISEYCATQA